MILASAITFVIFSVLSGISPSNGHVGAIYLIVVRMFLGLAVGAASALVPAYMSEMAPADRRRIAKLRPKVRRLGGVDLLLTHAPARGLNDGKDLPHRGFECFNAFLDEWQPRWFVHGHIHLFYDYKLPRVCQRGETTVINATERYTFETPDLEYHPAKKFFFLESFAAMFSR